MTLPSYAYQNPEKILLDAENRTCKGCIHRVLMWGLEYCAKRDVAGKHKMKRCKQYEEAKCTTITKA